MLSSYFKKKLAPKIYEEELALENLEPVEHEVEEEQDSKNSRTLYYRPKAFSEDMISFNPEKWSIDSFEIGRHLGRGKYGHVYLARERQTKHIVAIKILTKKQIMDCDILNQIRRELQIHSHLNHPNILRMFGFFFDEKRIYIIMEYATKGQLYAMLRKVGRFKEPLVSCYIRQMILAMQHLHQHNIIHRDLKPENILIFDDNVAKLSDFGWSVHTSQRRKTFCGTIDYICPEIVNRQNYSTQLDLWTIGVLTYELACGKAPFESNTRAETSAKIKKQEYEIPPFFSSELEDFVKRLLVVDPNVRMREDEALRHPFIEKYRDI